MSFTKSVSFNNRLGEANDGKIYVSVIDADASTGPFDVFITVVGPNGTVHATTDPTPEINNIANGGTGTWSVDIPLDSDDEYLAGEYSVTIKIQVDGGSVLETNTNTFTYTPVVTKAYTPIAIAGSSANNEVLSFVAQYNCATARIEMSDSNNYSDYEQTSEPGRVITVTPATATGESPTVQNLDYVEEIASVAFGFTDALYTCTFKVYLQQLDLTGEIDFAVNILFINTYVLSIACDTEICDLADCVETELVKLEALACNGVGWGGLSTKQTGRFDYAMALAQMASLYKSCGNYTKAAGYKAKLKTLLGSGCDCTTTDTATPTAYTPPA